MVKNSFLSSIDMYSYKFTLNFFKKKQISTLYGQISTIITIILSFFFIIYFAGDFLNRKSPTINYAKQYYLNYPITQLKSRNFFLAFRIINITEHSIDFSNKIFPVLYYLTRKKNESEIKISNQIEKIKFSKCESGNLNKREIDINNFNIQDFYCFNFSDYNFGEDINKEMSYILELNLCPNKLIYKPNDSNSINLCSEKNFINNLSNYKIEILYPEIYHQPYNISYLIRFALKSIKYSLSYNLLTNNYIYIQENKIKDDKGWLLRKYKEKNLLSIKNIKNEYILRNSDFLIEGGDSTFFTINLIYTKDYSIYIRYYIKIPEILANIIVFIRIIMLFFRNILDYFHSKIENLEIFYKIFDCSYVPKTNLNLNNISSNFNNSNSSNNINNLILVKNNTLKPFQKNSILSNRITNLKRVSHTPKNALLSVKDTKSKFYTDLQTNKEKKNVDTSNISSQVNLNEIPSTLQKRKMNLTVLSLWLNGNQSKEYKRDYLFYEKVKSYIGNMKDFSSLIQIGIDIGIIRFYLLNEFDNKIFKIKKKINPSIKDDMKLIIEFKEKDNFLFDKI